MARDAVELSDSSVAELADDEISDLSLDEGDDAVLSGAEHGIDLPVTEEGSVLGSSGSLGDVTLTGEATTGVIGAVAFPALLAGLSKEFVAQAPTALVTPDVAVDGLVADAEDAILAEPDLRSAQDSIPS